MLAEVLGALGANRYAQHSICLTNDPIMLFLYSGADFFAFVSFMIIGIAILTPGVHSIRFFVRFRPLFGAFIFLCGVSHFTMMLVLFVGVYRLDVFVRVAMATISIVSAIFVTRELVIGRKR